MTLKTGVMTAENSALLHRNKLHFKIYMHFYYIYKIICYLRYKYYCFYCMFDQINAAFVNWTFLGRCIHMTINDYEKKVVYDIIVK